MQAEKLKEGVIYMKSLEYLKEITKFNIEVLLPKMKEKQQNLFPKNLKKWVTKWKNTFLKLRGTIFTCCLCE